MYRIITDPWRNPQYEKRDFAIWCNDYAKDGVKGQPGDVVSIYPDRPRKNLPDYLKPIIKKAVDDGYRVLVGNRLCKWGAMELTYRIACGRYSRSSRRWFRTNRDTDKRVSAWLCQWGMQCYEVAGDKLVLAPIDFEICSDVKLGSPFLKWAATYKVPLAIFTGFRFLFHHNAPVPSVRDIQGKYPWDGGAPAYRYPFREVSEAFKTIVVEAWTGVGFSHGLNAGSLAKAEEFGFRGGFTISDEWRKWEAKHAAV